MRAALETRWAHGADIEEALAVTRLAGSGGGASWPCPLRRGADAASAELARQRLAEFSPSPSIIVHEGTRIVGLWLLQEPLADLAQVDRALRALARALGADYVSPQETLVAVPGTRTTRLHPAHTVEVMTWEPERRHTLDRLARP